MENQVLNCILNCIPFIKKLIYGNDRWAISCFNVKTPHSTVCLNLKNNYKTLNRFILEIKAVTFKTGSC